MCVPRDHPVTFFSRDIALIALPWDIENSLHLWVCARVYMRTITPITSHTSVRAAPMRMRKSRLEWKGSQRKKAPDCESPARAKDEHVAYSCFALSDRSQGLLCQCPAVVPSSSCQQTEENDERKVVLAGWTEYIYSR